ncbi:MAG: acetyl-CoA carboxylase biotin carboxyl carrier protein [Marvinbryantia sp.]|jgi:acetyl-CoA carboxylase biotin carboxyl carrier protein
MEFENLVRLIQTVSDSGLTELKYEENGVKLFLSKRPGKVQTNPVIIESQHQTDRTDKSEEISGQFAIAEGNMVTSPLVGVFYAAPSEDAQPFVTVGDRVKKGQTLAIVEAMKLMNDIECEFDGIVTEILVKNGQPVEYGQPLFRII